MRKTFLLVLVLVLACATLVGCVNTPEEPVVEEETTSNATVSNPTNSAKSDILDISLVESGYSFDEDGNYVYCGFLIKNPNTDWVVDHAQVEITLRDADGGVISTSSGYTGRILPESIGAGYSFLDTKGEVVASVDFELKKIGEYDVSKADTLGTLTADSLQAVGVKESESGFGRISFTGEIENSSSEDIENATIAIVLRNAEGNITSVESTYVNDISAGGKRPFEVSTYGTSYASYEIFISPGI